MLRKIAAGTSAALVAAGLAVAPAAAAGLPGTPADPCAGRHLRHRRLGRRRHLGRRTQELGAPADRHANPRGAEQSALRRLRPWRARPDGGLRPPRRPTAWSAPAASPDVTPAPAPPPSEPAPSPDDRAGRAPASVRDGPSRSRGSDPPAPDRGRQPPPDRGRRGQPHRRRSGLDRRRPPPAGPRRLAGRAVDVDHRRAGTGPDDDDLALLVAGVDLPMDGPRRHVEEVARAGRRCRRRRRGRTPSGSSPRPRRSSTRSRRGGARPRSSPAVVRTNPAHIPSGVHRLLPGHARDRVARDPIPGRDVADRISRRPRPVRLSGGRARVVGRRGRVVGRRSRVVGRGRVPVGAGRSDPAGRGRSGLVRREARRSSGVSSEWRKMSLPFVLRSSATRVLAAESKATRPPPEPMFGLKLSPSPWVPSSATLTRVSVPVSRSKRKMSRLPLVSSATRLVAADQKAT